MISKKSPGGANFPYYYKNGELFGGKEQRDAITLCVFMDEGNFLLARLRS